jgi:hypothetical protein
LSGCSQSESGGIVSFSGCTINTVGTAYKLHATDGSLTAADSSAFNVTLGPAAQLAFTQQPSNSTAAVAFPTQPKVTVQDAGGNTETGDNATTVTVAIGTNPGSGTLSGTKTVTVASGVATFSGLSIDKTGTGYTLSATSSPAHGSATSSTFNITLGAATKFNLSASSASITAGNTTDLTITAVDAGGNTVTSYTGSHNLIFSGATSSPSGTTPTVTNASGATVNFGTTTPISFTNGVAQVSGGTNGRATLYKAETASISATEGSMTTQTPASVTVSAGAAARLAWTHVTVSAGTLSSPCLFACTDTGLGNNGTFTANVSVTDSLGNTVSGLGTGHTVSVSTPTSGGGSGGSFTAPTSGTTVNLAISATGPADSTQQFTFKTQNSGNFTETFSTQTTAGTSYTSATASVTRQ